MRTGPISCAAILLLGLLAGCTTPSPSSTDPGYVVVDSPYDNRTVEGNSRPHLHDYWGGSHRLTVADTDVAAPGYLWFGGTPISVATLRPEPGKVVPQGTGWVNVTVSWTEDSMAVPPNRYQNPQLFVKTAADADVVLRANLTTNPQTVALPLNLSNADLPHQILSAWQFDLYLAPTPLPASTPLADSEAAFTGNVHFLVTADRTLPIPLFPGHPDQWHNQTAIALFKGGGHVFYDGDPTTGNWRCYGGCPVIYHPDSGVIVPVDASRVTIKLGLSGTSPTKLGIKFHGADSRDFATATLTSDTPTLRTYDVEVAGGGDGAYAKQSQWEIVPYIEGPKENGIVNEDYTIEAVAQRHI